MPPIQLFSARAAGLSRAGLAVRTQPPVFALARPGAAGVAASIAPVASQSAAANLSPALRVRDLKFIDPRFALRVSGIPGFAVAGVPRDQLTVPVSLSGELTDTTLLEDPRDATKKYFVMGYQLDVESTTHGPQFAARLLAKGDGAELSVTLVKAPPATVTRDHPTAQELPHEVALLIRYKQRINGQPSAYCEWAFTSTSMDGGRIRGVLALENLQKRNELYGAITDAELGCTLIVRRKAAIAVPVPAAAPPAPPAGIHLEPRPALLAVRPDIRAEFLIRRPFPPGWVSPGGTLSTPPPLFRQTDRTLDQELPFHLDPALNRYVFEGLGAVPPGASQGLLRKVIPWKGQPAVYYQDDRARNLFYYLPDTFKIGRRPASPHEPLMSVRFDSADGSKEQMRATLTYYAAPFINRDRLASALPAMQALVPPEILAASSGIELEPLLPDPSKITLKLAFPGADPAGGPFAPRPQASVDLRSGIVDALTMNLDQFRAVFEAMFSGGQLLFSGSVEFDLGGAGEQVPFQLRFQSLAEPFARWTQATDGDDLVISLANEIESKLRVLQLEAIVRQEDSLLVKPLTSATGSYPVEVEPGKTGDFRLPQASGMVLNGIDFSEVECAPDRETIYHLLLDPSTLPAYLREIKVKTFKPVFQEQPANPQNQVMSVVVDFQGGASVELTADRLEASVKVPVPLAGFIIGNEVSLDYHYRVTVARLGGVTADTQWRTGQSGILFPAAT